MRHPRHQAWLILALTFGAVLPAPRMMGCLMAVANQAATTDAKKPQFLGRNRIGSVSTPDRSQVAAFRVGAPEIPAPNPTISSFRWDRSQPPLARSFAQAPVAFRLRC